MRSPLAPLLLLSLATACARPTPAGAPEELASETAPAVSASNAAEAVPIVLASASAGPLLPAPYRRRLGSAVADNEACVTCHRDEAEAWRGSGHQTAASDPAFRRAFAVEPLAFCRGCHVPEGDAQKPPSRAVSELGVACVTCHVTEPGTVLAAPLREGAAERDERDERPPTPAHVVRRSLDFATTGGCASCHEFRFPGARGDDDGDFMQTTAREHARSPRAAEPCAGCHMPLRDGRRSHAFSEVRDASWLRAALDVVATRSGPHGITLTLTQRLAGHAFPTGDLFRRLEVGAEARAADGRVVRREVRHLTRHFVLQPGTPGRFLRDDDRLEGEPLSLQLLRDEEPPSGDTRQDAPGEETLAWWVTYQRVAAVGDGQDPRAAEIESQVMLCAGTLPRKDVP